MKKRFFFFLQSAADVQREVDRIEEILDERRAVRRMAFEMHMIRVRSEQDEQKRQQELQAWAFERREWDATFEAIRQIQRTYELDR